MLDKLNEIEKAALESLLHPLKIRLLWMHGAWQMWDAVRR